MLIQEGELVSLSSEKLNDAKREYFLYDQGFYDIVQASKKWRHYLIPMNLCCILIIKLYNTWEVNIDCIKDI